MTNYVFFYFINQSRLFSEFTVPNIDLAFTPESVTCPINSATGNAGESAATGDISSGNDNCGRSVITINNGLVNMNPPTVTPVLAKPPGSPPTYLPLSASVIAVVVQGTAATTEPTVTNSTFQNNLLPIPFHLRPKGCL
jgi:hypothetical protein